VADDSITELILTPCPVCQVNVEVYQDRINKKYGTKFTIPVVYYSQLMAVAYGANAKGETEKSRVFGEHSRRRADMPRMACPGLSSGAG
jgi:heterodisulfide reductase subunit B